MKDKINLNQANSEDTENKSTDIVIYKASGGEPIYDSTKDQ